MADTIANPAYCLEGFQPHQAATVASWVRSDAELFWLAPGTSPPITAAKVIAWTERRGRGYAFHARQGRQMVAYAELNAMPRDPRDLWIGHVLVDPLRRRQGIGRLLTETLIQRAFAQERAWRLSLVVFPDNLAALRCYRAAGFCERGEEFQCFGESRHRCRLIRLELTP